MRFESIDQPGWSSEVERNPKMSILFFWLERGGRRGSSPLTSPADHQKLNVIQKWAFYFFGWRGVADEGLSPLTSPADHQKLNVIQKQVFHFLAGEGWQTRFESITSPADHQKLNVIQKWAFHFLAGEGWQTGFESIDQPGWSSEVECNPKGSISFFWLERGGGWGLSPSTSPADHQKLNVIQKQAFYFFGWRGVADGVWVHRPARLIIRSWT